MHCTFTSFPLNASLMVGKSNWLMYLFPFIKLGNPDAFTVLVSRYRWYLVIAKLQLPALSFKGGVVSEGIFNLVPSSNKCTKLTSFNVSLFHCLKFAAMFNTITDQQAENFKHWKSEKLREGFHLFVWGWDQSKNTFLRLPHHY